jgi:hypothetical protein
MHLPRLGGSLDVVLSAHRLLDRPAKAASVTRLPVTSTE